MKTKQKIQDTESYMMSGSVLHELEWLIYMHFSVPYR